jgi:hypothetical protein
MIQEYEARIAALERLVGKQALELEFQKGALARTPTQKRAYDHRPDGLSIAEGCRLMGIPRSTFYDKPRASGDDTALVEAMHAIKDEFEAYGWRRMQADLRPAGLSREPQEDQAPGARTWFTAALAPTIRRHDRQRSRSADLPEPHKGTGHRRA